MPREPFDCPCCKQKVYLRLGYYEGRRWVNKFYLSKMTKKMQDEIYS